MYLCTECYIQKNGKTLMLYRNKKENDVNKNKWVGLGGKFEHGESPEQCLLREVREEAGVTLTEFKLRGFITFNQLNNPEELYYIFVYTATDFIGEIGECNEGELHWIDNDKITELELWEGDRLFWRWILSGDSFFSANFTYNGDTLAGHEVVFH